MDDDWSLLSLDLLRKLGEKLHYPHRIVFRTVCNSWCSALPCIVFPCPWLLLPADQIDDSCTFLSFPSDNEHSSSFEFSPVPPLHGVRYAGSNIGWVAIVDFAFNISLLNPLTGTQIHLPSFFPLPDVESLPNCGGYLFRDKECPDPFLFEYETYRDYYIKKVAFSSNPTPTDYTAMVIRHQYPLAFTKAGISKWISLDFSVMDIIYHDGLFYALRCVSVVFAIDLSGDNPVKRVIIDALNSDNFVFSDSFLSRSYIHHEMYLAFSNAGELFLIMRRNSYEDAPNETKKYVTEGFLIFKYNCESSSCWEEVRCLKNKSVFIGMNNAYLLSMEDFIGLRANCIYFTDTFEGMNCSIVMGRENLDVGFFDLEQEKIERCCCLSHEKVLPPPIWFSPSIEL